MAHDGWTADRAYAEMKQYKFEKGFLQGFFHTELKNYVYDYYSQLSRQNAASATQKMAHPFIRSRLCAGRTREPAPPSSLASR